MQVTQKTNVKHDVEGEHEGCVGVIAAHFEQTNHQNMCFAIHMA